MTRRGRPYAITRDAARAAVLAHDGNVSAAARALGLAWVTVRRAWERPPGTDGTLRARRSA